MLKWLLVSFVLIRSLTMAQDSIPQAKIKSNRIIGFSFAGGLYAGSVISLNQLWYKQYRTRSFHFFNDAGDWLQMDKVGHSYSAYHIGRLGIEGMRWMGYPEKKSIWLGGFLGTFYLTTIEVMDGFSSGWGFSNADMGANIMGSSLVTFQELALKRQFVQMKFSFHQTQFPQYRPSLLGEDLSKQILKDYNGQSYWLSFSPFFFSGRKLEKWRWFCLSLGYSATGMISGSDNYVIVQQNGNVIGNDRYRRWLCSIDIDLTQIPVKKKWLRQIFATLNCLKVPAPALEINEHGLKAYGIFF